jgi:hypothetical protein
MQTLLHHGMVACICTMPPALVRQTTEHDHVVDRPIIACQVLLTQPSELLCALPVTPRRPGLALQTQLSLTRHQTGQHLEQAGLTGAIRSDDASPLSGFKVRIHCV